MFNLVKFIMGFEGATGGVPLKYGAVRGIVDITCPVYMAASEVISPLSGVFLTLDSSGNGTITDDTDTTVFGFAEAAAQTCSSTARGTVVSCIVDTNTIFRIPVLQAATAGATEAAWNAIIGKKMDLDIISNVQGLDADVTTRGHVIVVGQDAWLSSVATYGTGSTKPNNTTGCRWVDVKINSAVQGK